MVGPLMGPIATVTDAAVPDQHLYRYKWNTKTVADGCGFIVAVAENASGPARVRTGRTG